MTLYRYLTAGPGDQVNLFVTASGEGVMARDTPPKILQRLAQVRDDRDER